MILQNKDRLIHHIHIPRTGGRYLYNVLQKAGYYDVANSWGFWEGYQVLHLSYNQAKRYYLKRHWTEDSFAVVRNPIDKFCSALYTFFECTNIKDVNLLEDREYFIWVLEEKPMFIKGGSEYHEKIQFYHNGLKQCFNHFWSPQFKHIGPSTKVWKYEDGYNDNFKEWLKEEVNINVSDINLEEISYEERYFDNHKIDISDKIKDNILEYYYNDFVRFYPNYI